MFIQLSDSLLTLVGSVAGLVEDFFTPSDFVAGLVASLVSGFIAGLVFLPIIGLVFSRIVGPIVGLAASFLRLHGLLVLL